MSSSRERPKRLHRLSNLGFRASLKVSMEHSLFATTFQLVPPRQASESTTAKVPVERHRKRKGINWESIPALATM